MTKKFKNLKKLNLLDYFIEFLIVFLGISIAFYINQRAESKKVKEIEITYINEIRQDLLSDTSSFTWLRDLFQEEISKYSRVRMHISESKNVDSIAFYCKELAKGVYFHPGRTTYQLLVENGEILKISNLNLRKELANYYAYNETFRVKYDEVNNLKRKKLYPFIEDNFNLHENKVSSRKAFVSLRLQNVLHEIRNAQIHKINSYKKARRMAVESIKMVESEIAILESK